MSVRSVPPDLESGQACKRVKASDALEQYAETAAIAFLRFMGGEDAAVALDGVLAPQVVWHDSLLPERELVGLAQLQALGDCLRGAVPDLRLSLQRPLHVGQGGVVLGYWRAEGTHSGPLGPSLPPSGAAVSWEGSLLIRTAPHTQQLPHHSSNQEHWGGREDPQADGKPEAREHLDAPGEATQGSAEQQPSGQSGEGSGAAAEAGLHGVEVWWSWDPIFLFRQMGWQQHGPGGVDEGSAEGADADAEAGTAEATGPVGSDDLASRTAAAARAAYATEGAAAEAAGAAVAAAASAASKLAESGSDSLAAAHAANRAVVELYFHTYNTGHYRVLDHIVHPEYQYDGLLDLGGRRGRAAMAAMMGGWRDCLPDLVIGHELFEAVGPDKVTFRWVIRGSHATPGSTLLGLPAPPPGQAAPKLLVRGVTTLTLREGRIVRKVSHANAAATLAQLGAARHPVIPLPA